MPSAPLAKRSSSAGGVLDGEAANLVRGQRLHLGDLAADEAEIVDVVDEVDQQRAAAVLAPPRHVEVIVGLLQEPQSDHGRELAELAGRPPLRARP